MTLDNKDKINFEKRIFILMKKNQNWSNMRLALHFGTTPQAVSVMYQKVKHMKVSELEKEYKDYLES